MSAYFDACPRCEQLVVMPACNEENRGKVCPHECEPPVIYAAQQGTA